MNKFLALFLIVLLFAVCAMANEEEEGEELMEFHLQKFAEAYYVVCNGVPAITAAFVSMLAIFVAL